MERLTSGDASPRFLTLSSRILRVSITSGKERSLARQAPYMTARKLLWITRFSIIPVLLFYPIACLGLAGLIVGWPKGDNFPNAGFLALLLVITTAFPLARRTLFARADRLPQAKRVLLGLLIFDLSMFLLGHFLKALR